jgi:hypothetical protein
MLLCHAAPKPLILRKLLCTFLLDAVSMIAQVCDVLFCSIASLVMESVGAGTSWLDCLSGTRTIM